MYLCIIANHIRPRSRFPWQNSELGIIVGSTRRNSINRRLAAALAQFGGRRPRGPFIPIDDLPMPDRDDDDRSRPRSAA